MQLLTAKTNEGKKIWIRIFPSFEVILDFEGITLIDILN